MGDILHLWALAPAAASACCVAADRRWVRAPELAASVVMLLAMIDASITRSVPTVYWAAVLLGGAAVLAAVRSPRRSARRPSPPASGMVLHTTLGMVLMAALMVAMSGGDAGPAAHAHGASPAAVSAAFAIAVVGYAIWSGVEVGRAHSILVRAQFGAMGLSTLLMATGLWR